ncbi:MAG: hypothetical protein EKK53_21430 [Burkholderiales bacterium]|nr:MAG: hypothetical protein EKK53_21430 [Burkholderiales bacterium]
MLITSKTKFCNNPWGLTVREAELLWLLTEFSRDDVGARIGIGHSAFAMALHRAKTKVGAKTATAAVVEFDRWWQGAKGGVRVAVLNRMEIELFETVEPSGAAQL